MAAVKGRTHNPDQCWTCIELPHLAAFGLPIWHICDRLGMRVGAVAKHVRSHPALANQLSPRVLDELRAADSAARHHRSTRQKEAAA